MITAVALVATYLLCRFVVTEQARSRPDGHSRRRAQGSLLRLRIRPATSCSCGRCRRCCARWRARSTCRRSASSIPARCSRRTPSSWPSGWRSADAAPWLDALVGALLLNGAKSWLTAAFPSAWLYVLGGLFVLVTLFLPKGLAGLLTLIRRSAAKRATRYHERASGRRPDVIRQEILTPTLVGPSPNRRPWRHRPGRFQPLPGAKEAPEPSTTAAPAVALWVEGLTVSFDGFKALDNVNLMLDRGRAPVHHRPERRRQNHPDGRDHGKDPTRHRVRVPRKPPPRPDRAVRMRDRRAGRGTQISASHGASPTIPSTKIASWPFRASAASSRPSSPACRAPSASASTTCSTPSASEI